MKLLSLFLAAAVLVISLPACATAPKKKDECCGSASCTPSPSCPASGPHQKAKKSH
jgi:hypothetical protein